MLVTQVLSYCCICISGIKGITVPVFYVCKILFFQILRYIKYHFIFQVCNILPYLYCNNHLGYVNFKLPGISWSCIEMNIYDISLNKCCNAWTRENSIVGNLVVIDRGDHSLEERFSDAYLIIFWQKVWNSCVKF